MTESFPRQKARTRDFTLGAPRSFSAAADGRRVAFLRSPAGDDPRTALWVLDVAAARERLVADPVSLAHAAGDEPAAERARRERLRETAGGIVAYAIDRAAEVAAFALSGQLFVARLDTDEVRELDVPTPVFDPRPDPAGRQIAFVHERALYVVSLADGAVTRLAGEEDEAVSWGVAEFIAAEEMDRDRGYWWSPDGTALLCARVDETPVRELWIADAADPGSPPRRLRYPTAGSANAEVRAYVVAVDGRAPVELQWDREAHPYLARAHWDDGGPLVTVQSRDQRTALILAADRRTGETTTLGSLGDEHWVDLLPGVPQRLGDGRLVTVTGAADSVALRVGERVVTPAGLDVRGVAAVTDASIVFTASTEPTEVDVWRWEETAGLTRLTPGGGVHSAAATGEVPVLGSAALDADGVTWRLRDHVFASHAQRPAITPAVEMLSVGERELRVGLVLPRGFDGQAALPVLMDPYGGPHFQRVMGARGRWRDSQWFADQGFAVVVADGRGTPGRGRAWARAVAGDLAGAVLEDQVDALQGVAASRAYLDLTRVAIRGWSFGGFLAALAVLRRPDVFHAAVAGAPVTDWRLYDTHYTERYLGVDPDGDDHDAYERSSLLSDAPELARPLLIIHGLADDNVLSANTLKLSQRLTEAGRPHSVLPLTGVTHMTPQEAVAENLLTLQVEFLRRALGA